MLFRETVAAYCENHTKHTNTLSGQNAEFSYVKAGGKYSDHCALNCWNMFEGTSYLEQAKSCVQQDFRYDDFGSKHIVACGPVAK
jgi:hypothetical protein